MMHRVAAGMHR